MMWVRDIVTFRDREARRETEKQTVKKKNRHR